jgi:hypothetical protein
LVAELDDTDSYEYVKHLTDVHRLHLFDIVMQYRAIFFDTSAQVGICLLQYLEHVGGTCWGLEAVLTVMASSCSPRDAATMAGWMHGGSSSLMIATALGSWSL